MHENSIPITQMDNKSKLAITPHFLWNATVFLPSSLSISPWKEGFDINIYWKHRAIKIKTPISIITWLTVTPSKQSTSLSWRYLHALGRSWACLRSRPTCDTFSIILNTYLRHIPLWAADCRYLLHDGWQQRFFIQWPSPKLNKISLQKKNR